MKFKLIEDNQYIRNKKRLPEFSHADLLTAEEVEKLPVRLRKYDHWWWLNSPGRYYDFAGYVGCDGHIDEEGYYVGYSLESVRPALRITNLNDYKVGSLFKFGGKWFQIIDENTAFCLSDIGGYCYDYGGSNVYEKSSIKQHLDNWFSENNK